MINLNRINLCITIKMSDSRGESQGTPNIDPDLNMYRGM